MSQSKAQLIGGVGISTAQSITVGAAVTINSSGVVASGIITSTSFIGNVTGNVTGNLTGTASTATAAATAYGLTGSIDGSNVTSLNADNLSSGTVPDARFPATLPSASGANLTSLNASNLGSGTVPDARFPATLPAASGANLTSLNASNLSSGTVATARLASGTANSGTYLRGDQTWAAISSGLTISDDTSTNATRYLTFTSATSGSVSSENVSSSKLTFNPSTGKLTVTGFTASNNLVAPVGNTAARDSTQGSIRYNSQLSVLEFYDGSTWNPVATGYFTSTTNGAIFGGGYTPSPPSSLSTIQYVDISSLGNGLFFGNLSTPRRQSGQCSSSVRGLVGDGLVSNDRNSGIEYVNISSKSDASDFGSLLEAVYDISACSNSTRGIFSGGNIAPAGLGSNVISYVTIASIGNAANFGDLIQGRSRHGGCSSPTRGIFAGGYAPGAQNTIDYITIASTGNATDFGDLTKARFWHGALSSSTRGVFGGGQDPTAPTGNSNVIDYITIASTGNATDFGDLSTTGRGRCGAAGSTRGIFAGTNGAPTSGRIEYITIASTGDSVFFGDLSSNANWIAASSMATNHGGLQ